LQAEVQYHYLRERVQSMDLPTSVRVKAAANLVVTPQLRLVLNDEGVSQVQETLKYLSEKASIDILVIDPIRNVFDGGTEGNSENDNNAMLFFLRERVEKLRDAINPSAGIILVHHTKKMGKRQVEEDPFLALSGAGSLRGYYTTGMLLFRPDENRTDRTLVFELRNGPGITPKIVDKSQGEWRELDRSSERLVNQDYGERLDAERSRKREVILQLLFDEAMEGRAYTAAQFAEAFEGKAGLSGEKTIRNRISALSTQGYIRFFQDGNAYGLPPHERSRQGYLCVEDMLIHGQRVLPTHYKSRQTGAVLPVENPDIWSYSDGEDA